MRSLAVPYEDVLGYAFLGFIHFSENLHRGYFSAICGRIRKVAAFDRFFRICIPDLAQRSFGVTAMRERVEVIGGRNPVEAND